MRVSLLVGLVVVCAVCTIASFNVRSPLAMQAPMKMSSKCFSPAASRSLLQRTVSANAAANSLFMKKFQVVGVGHDIALDGKKVNFQLGSTGPATLEVPEGIEVRVPRSNEIIIASKEKQKVLDFAENIQELKKDSGKEGVRRVGKGIKVVDTLDPTFEKKLKLIGVGYRAAVKGNTIVLNLGYSHPITLPILDGVKIDCTSNTELTLSSKSAWAVGQMAYNIREWRKPEPYKGKGIRYEGEKIIMKEGKRKK
eukprot:CAMPEP_0167754414 /NCGR_PEP_ID=MMETSP0110_2-20121227/8254_1 /TAXON_ID=629695 /ORGANISM="Gymnochlora sp., Strain CCMP2014" /LENGTH=252 /DNA_ID=CAMNT_0007640285 /DNA_START=59 /DNA_END=817 /DNA_ORIENTATION=+